MLIDTHCHLNMIAKKEFDRPLTTQELHDIKFYINQAKEVEVNKIINVGTSLIESLNCIEIAKKYSNVYATVGIHPNDFSVNYKQDLTYIKKLVEENLNNNYKIVGIGECGMDKHYPEYNLEIQEYGFRYQIELALKHDLALVVHTRNAACETLKILDDYKKDIKKCIIHCFSEDQDFANTVTSWGFFLGIGGTITYPKNNTLRDVVKNIDIKNIVLETDAPFLPPQYIRGKTNTPKEIYTIANFVSELKSISIENVSIITSNNASYIFKL